MWYASVALTCLACDSSGNEPTTTSGSGGSSQGGTTGQGAGVGTTGGGGTGGEATTTSTGVGGGTPPLPDSIVVHSRTGVADGAHGGTFVPGGLTDGHFYFDASPQSGFDSFEYAFRVVTDPGDTTSYFWAQQFFFVSSGGSGGYTGLQTNGYIGGQTVGKIVIFSIWDTLEAVPGPGASCEPFGGEGIGFSCRKPFSWSEGTDYLMRLSSPAPDWWDLHVREHGGREELLGSIRVPPGWGQLQKFAASFAEYYGPVKDCGTIPLAEAEFKNVSANDGSEVPTSADAATYGPCATSAMAWCDGDGCQ